MNRREASERCREYGERCYALSQTAKTIDELMSKYALLVEESGFEAPPEILLNMKVSVDYRLKSSGDFHL